MGSNQKLVASRRLPTSAKSKGAVASRLKSFPIVAIGASAGGLQALEAFFRKMPAGHGIAFIIVQHLDPEQKSVMAELIQKFTAMPVRPARDRIKLAPESIVVLPPDREITIRNLTVHLKKRSARAGRPFPIDALFRSLALDQGEKSIGVILSGMGMDGAGGLQYIKEYGGTIFVQAPKDARFASMPESAIETGLVDVVAPAAELPRRIFALLSPAHRSESSRKIAGTISDAALHQVFEILRARGGNDFSQYKKTSILRRLEHRLEVLGIKRIAEYLRLLRANEEERDFLARNFLIGVTSFFRDPEAWSVVRRLALLPMLKARCAPDAPPLRAWVVGTSTGEEAYSLAILLRETIDRMKVKTRPGFQIFATDLDERAIARARTGLYPESIVADVGAARFKRFFKLEEGGCRIDPGLRDAITFAPHNLVMDPPYARIDFIACRNLLIYFEPELQKRIISLFHFSLNPGGALFLGSAETIGAQTDLFKPITGASHLYLRRQAPRHLELDLHQRFRVPKYLDKRQSGGKSSRPERETAENLQSLQEELRAANEELRSANEEMRLSNEELTTSREEIQVVNEELEAHVEELTRLNNDLDNFMKNEGTGFIFLDLNLKIRRFNPSAAALFKLIPGDLGRPFADLAHHLEYPALIEDARKVLATQVGTETIVATREGCHVLARIEPYHTADGRIDGLVLSFTDVTAVKAAEAEKYLFSMVAERMSSGLYIYHLENPDDDRTLRLVACNPASSVALGLDAGEIVGRMIDEIFPGLRPADIPRRFADVVRSGRPFTELEFHYGDSRVERQHFMFEAFQLPGDRVGVLFENITDLKQAEAHLLRAEKMAAVGQLAAGVAHEFNNIMNNIGLCSQMMRLDERLGPFAEIQHSLTDIENQIHRGAEIVRGMMALSRPEPAVKTPVALCEMLDEVLRIQRRQLELESIAVEAAIDPALAATVNRGRVLQVFLNLIINSRHAMKPKGSGILKITAGRVGDQVRIAFQDTGIGMDEEILKKIFDPFFTTKGAFAEDALGIKGTGLGLSVSQSIIQAEGGEIAVESSPGQGATVTVNLPASDAIAAAPPGSSRNAEAPVPPEASSQPQGRRSTPSLLLVDDEKILDQSIGRFFRKRGYQVTFCDNSRIAAECLAGSERYAIMIFDQNMPGLTGTQLARLAREAGQTGGIFIATGLLDTEPIAAELAALEIERIIRKPLNLAELLAAVECCLARDGSKGVSIA